MRYGNSYFILQCKYCNNYGLLFSNKVFKTGFKVFFSIIIITFHLFIGINHHDIDLVSEKHALDIHSVYLAGPYTSIILSIFIIDIYLHYFSFAKKDIYVVMGQCITN